MIKKATNIIIINHYSLVLTDSVDATPIPLVSF